MRVPRAVKVHLRHNVVGYIALFCFAIGGTAIALPGKNKVDSGDIKQKSVHSGDLASGAVTRRNIAHGAVSGPKLATGAVGSAAVLDHSLTSRDIDESTLSRPGIAAGSVGPLEEADRERRILVSPGYFYEGSAELGEAGPFASLNFDPASDEAAYLSIEVPGGRVAGTPLGVRLLWSADAGGDVVWEIASLAAGVGETMAIKIAPRRSTSGTAESIVTATSFTIPPDEVQNGDLLGMRVSRNADDPADTLVADARLHMLEISYMSTG
jgi:hypothetical protein